MSLWRQLTRGLRVLVLPAAADDEVADEVSHYLAEAQAELVARGVDAEEARRAAQLEVGNVTVVRQEIRSHGWEHFVREFLGDLSYAARRIRHDPGFSCVAALTLALGIGAATAMFSVVNPILLEPLPYPDARSLVSIWYASPDGKPVPQAFGSYREIVARSHSFAAAAVVSTWQPTLSAGEPERLHGQRVSADYFRTLGVMPSRGRTLGPTDDRPSASRVVIISDGLWRRRFQADRAILGRPITLDDDAYTVVGIMPPGFENVLSPSTEVWTALQYDPALPSLEGREWGHHLLMVGRLRPGVRAPQAIAEINGVARAAIPEFKRPPWAAAQHGYLVRPLQDEVTGAVKPVLLAVLGAIVLLLLIAVVNVTNLVLARGSQRRAEMAVRAALGAGRGRLARQLLTESLVLAVLGGALGLLVGRLGINALLALAPSSLPRVGAVRLDGTVFVFALAMTALAGVAVGLAPALQLSRGAGLLAQAGSSRVVGPTSRIHGALVVAEVALALVLLVGAGLLWRSVDRLFGVEPGFDPAHVLTMQVQASGRKSLEASVSRQFFERAIESVRQVPGVLSAAFTSQLPLSGDEDLYGVRFESGEREAGEAGSAFRYAVTPGYVETMAIPLRRGRSIDPRDTPGAPVGVLVSESLARRMFPNGDPLGQRLHLGRTDLPWYTVVGVVGNVKQVSLAVDQPDAVYIAASQWYSADQAMSLVVRVEGDAAALAPAIRQAVWRIDKRRPIVRVSTLQALVAASTAERRFAMILFEAFALVSLGLAALGIYGVLAGAVAERTREIGLRSAMGASRGRILSEIVRRGAALTGIGVAVGLGAAAAASRAVASLLFGVSRLDAWTYIGVSALLFAVAGIASWLPAWRAARIDPVVALRME